METVILIIINWTLCYTWTLKLYLEISQTYPENTTMIIEDANLEDGGVYKVIASNKLGANELTFTLVVGVYCVVQIFYLETACQLNYLNYFKCMNLIKRLALQLKKRLVDVTFSLALSSTSDFMFFDKSEHLFKYNRLSNTSFSLVFTVFNST